MLFPRGRSPRLAAVAMGVAAATALTACGGGGTGTASSGQASGKPVAGDTLTIASPTPPISLNPALNGNGVPLDWFDALAYEPLIVRHGDNSVEPGLATSWAYSNHNKRFTLHLRSGVKFTDGTPLTAEAVVKWIRYYKAKGTFAFNLSSLSSAVATGPLEVTLNLRSPDPLYPYYLDQEGVVGNIASAGAVANPGKMATATFGAGPYQLDRSATIPNSQYVYVRNPHYWKPSRQHWKKIVVKIIGDDNATLAAVRSGQVQVAVGAATTAATAKSAGVVVTAHSGGVTGIVVDDRDGKIVPALKSVKVRQALNYAVDRKGIAKTVYRGYGSPSGQYKPAGTDGYVAALDKQYPYDPAKAKRLLREAGHPGGFRLDVLIQPGVPGGTLLAQALAQEWSAIGVHVKLVSSATFSDYVTKATSHKYAATTFVYDYQPFIWEANELFSPTGVYNFLGTVNPRVEALRARINALPLGSRESTALERQLMTLTVREALSVPVAATDAIVYSAKNIGGVDYSGSFPVPNPTDWYATG
jgi:peptide/nickel transport system substrate-binding protein